MNEIFERLVKASDAYYNGTPIMEDSEFDALVDIVTQSHPDHPILKTIGAPTRDDSPWEKYHHKMMMGSLSKATNDEELVKFFKKHPLITKYIISEKLDGISINCEYNDGMLEKAITRGDGVEGEIITRNFLKMKGCNHSIQNKDFVSVRGEIIILKADFDMLNSILKARGEEPYKNMRNCVSGIARRFDGMYSEYLTVQYYDNTVGDLDKFEKFVWLKNNGFDVAKHWMINTIEHVRTIYNAYVERDRAELDYEIDGLVLEIDDRDYRNREGFKAQKPRFAIAYKFPSLAATTQILDIEWNVGVGGNITPVAILEPIEIGGITIRRASLHNRDNVKKLALRRNDIVLVSRRNDVIPYVEKIVHKSKDFAFVIPTKCPECNHPLYIDGAFLSCHNVDCRGQRIGNILKWTQKSGMSSQGLGIKTIEKLYDFGLIALPHHLYKLTQNDVLLLDGFKEKSSQKVVEIIQSHRKTSLADFIGGLNLGDFGSSLAQNLVDAGYDTIEKIKKLTFQQLISIEGIGENRAAEFMKNFGSKIFQVSSLLDYVTIEEEKPTSEPSGDIFNGMSFCFTGAIKKETPEGKRFTRKMMEALVIENGGTTSSVKTGLTYLVQADPNSQSSKTKKALSLGVTILAEDDFFKMLGE